MDQKYNKTEGRIAVLEKKCEILRFFKEILGSASFLGRKPWKMAGIQKFLRIMFIHDKWHQKNFSSVNFEDSGILPLPLLSK